MLANGRLGFYVLALGLLGCGADASEPRASQANVRVEPPMETERSRETPEQREQVTPRGPTPASASANQQTSRSEPQRTETYPGTGFVVHEWGTNTVVVSSDGKLQRGMHHEEEDLPSFVYDRVKQGSIFGYPSVDKMETPVDYFYSDRPISARVSVGMPNGLLTQWYPAAAEFAPSVVMSMENAELMVDPRLDPTVSLQTPHCIEKYRTLTGGLLDWGNVEILPRAAQVSFPEAPLERYTWSHARDVAANPLRVQNPTHDERAPDGTRRTGSKAQNERFLFYRGLGNFAIPGVVAEAADGLKLSNRSTFPITGPVFVLNVSSDAGAFTVKEVTLNRDEEVALPAPEVTAPMDVFVDQLEQAMTEALVATGLYRDEAVAMVRTWRRQWFRTPGVRVLYFAPAAWIDREVPLTIRPAPETLLRVMVMRVELLQRAVEQDDTKIAATFASDPRAAEAYFSGLGRFAEPRLRRALELLGHVPEPAARFLAAIAHADVSTLTE